MDGDWELMKFRDIQVAEDIGKRFELGWFDVEFTMYGCVYWSPNDDKMYYKISSLAEDIYNFIENGMQKDIFSSNVMSFTQKCPVPSGMKELIAQDVKNMMAIKLRENYSKEFLRDLWRLAEYYTENSAAQILWNEADQIEGTFEEEDLQQFEEIVHYSYSCRKIDRNNYEKLLQWIKEGRKNMGEDFSSKDIFEKTIYGIAYQKGGQIHYIENARKEYIYEKAYFLEQNGIFITPIFHKTYWYNYEYRLLDVRKDFTMVLKQKRNKDYQEKIKLIKYGGFDNISCENFSKMLKRTLENGSKEEIQTLVRYGYRWGICIPEIKI